MTPPRKRSPRPDTGDHLNNSARASGTAKRRERSTTIPVHASAEAVMVAASGIDPDVATARGYQRVTDEATLRFSGFGAKQRRVPGLLVPMHSVVPDEGVVLHQFRPQTPRSYSTGDHQKVIKYETPTGSRMRLDCPPTVKHLLGDTSIPLWITEGSRKADAAVSAGLCCISLAGVWNWKGTRSDGSKGPLEDWDHIALTNREVYVAYDSDVMEKEDVRKALQALTAFLALHGARVRWVYLPMGDGDWVTGVATKVGLDDYLAAGRTAEDLMRLAQRPELIVTVGGQLHDMTVDAIAALHVLNEPPFLFRRADVLVEALSRGVDEVSRDRLRYRMAKHVDWQKAKKVGDEFVYVPANPTTDVVANTLAAIEEWPFPPLDRVVYSPVFATDGSLVQTPGYHQSSRTLYVPPTDLKIRPVPDDPSPKQVRKALSLYMDDLFGDFVFAGDTDRAHALALALQPFARDLIRGNTPLYGVEAPKQGTGKTLLVESALAPSNGQVDSYAEPAGDEEMEKRITTAMASAQPVFFVDNIVRTIKYPSLATALTKAAWSGRILGESSRITAPITCTWVLTANNPQYSDDIARRVVPIRLDAQMETPHQRTGFSRSLPGWALEHRADLIWAAAVLIRSWIAAERPAPSEDTPAMGKFGPWRRVMGGILNHVGVEGFLDNRDRLQQSTPEQDALRVLAKVMIKAKGLGEPFGATEVARFSYGEADVMAAVDPQGLAKNEHGLRSRCGAFLTRHVDQITGSYRLALAPRGDTGGNRYRFEQVEGL